jgi:hypothetical protein
MHKPKIEVQFIPDPQLVEEERLRGIAKWLVRDYLASLGQKELITEDRKPVSPAEELLKDRNVQNY